MPAPRVDMSLVKAVVRAHRWRQMLESGEYASSAELAKAEKVNDSYLSRILRLTLIAPDIIEGNPGQTATRHAATRRANEASTGDLGTAAL
jgi:hypothetical protein